MNTSVVTGGAGFLGSHLCEYLLERGDRVICVDNLDTGSLENIEHIRDSAFVFRNHDMIRVPKSTSRSAASITWRAQRAQSTTSAFRYTR